MQRIRKTYRSKGVHRIEKMFQTEKYKLNLIEPTDPFLPDGLNENTQKMENAMIAHEENIEQRLVVLESFHFTYGVYYGNYDYSLNITTQFIPLPFKPKAVFVKIAGVSNGDNSALSTDLNSPGTNYLTLAENGMTVSENINFNGVRYNYIAFG